MARRKRTADYVATLIYVDEPQLVLLKALTVDIIAVAVPSNDPAEATFLATTVTPTDLENYLDGNTDLRFLFIFPRTKKTFYFDLMKMDAGRVVMDPFDGQIPDAHLPAPRLFSSEHTEEFKLFERVVDEQRLIIDGDWEMPEFGDFYGSYSEVYYFINSVNNYKDHRQEAVRRRNIAEAFRDKPYRGGSSYRYFYRDIISQTPREQRAGLESINYNSPGVVTITGDNVLFGEVRHLIDVYITHRGALTKMYAAFHQYLSRAHLLQLAGDRFARDNPHSAYIEDQTRQLSNSMGLADFDTMLELADGNRLVTAKLVLSLFRRIEEAATFFAQGRMNYV